MTVGPQPDLDREENHLDWEEKAIGRKRNFLTSLDRSSTRRAQPVDRFLIRLNNHSGRERRFFAPLDRLSWRSINYCSHHWPVELRVDMFLDRLSWGSTSSLSGSTDWAVFYLIANFFNLKPFKQVWKTFDTKF